ncbi:uncharacterized protein PITG_00977 [Phytophthora infestans T30-4]|uniref:Transmembrane protein n=1 Tax=Phytophthora infestans (strain T30-4) TaxID=403677 RepID=D0MS53_PHYIT|nr:uncharacterized protein PITG_00977 [Phytophthora infestans T30-4]EEY58322.1 hypothetical protein PITG_00977 [Phytophthora infestans T30-4]|eukprot:XP_002909508.1 hypothetical protein PITG_00977 [Phytophthora infestans T30-4]
MSRAERNKRFKKTKKGEDESQLVPDVYDPYQRTYIRNPFHHYRDVDKLIVLVIFLIIYIAQMRSTIKGHSSSSQNNEGPRGEHRVSSTHRLYMMRHG